MYLRNLTHQWSTSGRHEEDNYLLQSPTSQRANGKVKIKNTALNISEHVHIIIVVIVSTGLGSRYSKFHVTGLMI